MAQKITLILSLLSLALSGTSMPNPADALTPRAAQTAVVDVYTLLGCTSTQVGGVNEYTVKAGDCTELRPIPNVPETGFLSYRVSSAGKGCEFEVFPKTGCDGERSEADVTEVKTCRNVPPSFQSGSLPVGAQVGGFSGKLICK